jgi:hypothetical protein
MKWPAQGRSTAAWSARCLTKGDQQDRKERRMMKQRPVVINTRRKHLQYGCIEEVIAPVQDQPLGEYPPAHLIGFMMRHVPCWSFQDNRQRDTHHSHQNDVTPDMTFRLIFSRIHTIAYQRDSGDMAGA